LLAERDRLQHQLARAADVLLDDAVERLVEAEPLAGARQALLEEDGIVGVAGEVGGDGARRDRRW
jgi:hypothetical protein